MTFMTTGFSKRLVPKELSNAMKIIGVIFTI